jgi:hypothetical protein
MQYFEAGRHKIKRRLKVTQADQSVLAVDPHTLAVRARVMQQEQNSGVAVSFKAILNLFKN